MTIDNESILLRPDTGPTEKFVHTPIYQIQVLVEEHSNGKELYSYLESLGDTGKITHLPIIIVDSQDPYQSKALMFEPCVDETEKKVLVYTHDNFFLISPNHDTNNFSSMVDDISKFLRNLTDTKEINLRALSHNDGFNFDIDPQKDEDKEQYTLKCVTPQEAKEYIDKQMNAAKNAQETLQKRLGDAF